MHKDATDTWAEGGVANERQRTARPRCLFVSYIRSCYEKGPSQLFAFENQIMQTLNFNPSVYNFEQRSRSWYTFAHRKAPSGGLASGARSVLPQFNYKDPRQATACLKMGQMGNLFHWYPKNGSCVDN